MRKHKPNFLVVGAMKGSTSAAAMNLNRNQDVYCLTPHWKNKIHTKYNISSETMELAGQLQNANSKETDFFNLEANYSLGMDFYTQYFPFYRLKRGEASPNYFHVDETQHYPNTIKNILEGLGPGTQIIILLRDPITRSFSHWNMIQKPESTFGVRFKNKTFNECTEQMSHPNAKNSILNRSIYIDNLNKFREAFGVENVYVALQEELRDNPLVEYNKIFNFLDVPEVENDTSFQEIHMGSYDTELDTPTVEWLKTYFKDSVDQLKALYPDLDYSKWHSY